GDTLFRGSCGRTDLPGGDMDEELKSLARLCSLPGDYEVYPGHMDSSTLERERNFNYYCREAKRRY
ncbi:MAG: MBL fold metallo-hydrolase, partial [Candidatus Limivicinus sp.]